MIGPGSPTRVPIPSSFPSLSSSFNQSDWKLIGNCDCFGNDLIPNQCGNSFNAIAIGKQLIADGKCIGFVVGSGRLWPKSEMQNIHAIGGNFWSFINVDQNPYDYIFQLGVDYPEHPLDGMPLTKLVVNDRGCAVSINNVLPMLETNSSVNASKKKTNFAVFGTDEHDGGYNNFVWFKNSSKVPGKYESTKSSYRDQVSFRVNRSSLECRLD